MDRVIVQKKGFRWREHGPYVAVGCLLLALCTWLIFGNHAATLRISKDVVRYVMRSSRTMCVPMVR